jgi:hypothetical protein
MRTKLLLALLGLSLSAAGVAAEPGLCKSMCTDTAYLRCVRACDAPAHGGTDSVILRRRQEAGGTGTAKP